MRNLLHRIFNRPSRRLARISPPHVSTEARRIRNVGAFRRPPLRPRITAGQVRDRQFNQVRRGLDPTEVYAFLHRVAEDVADLRDEVQRTRDENMRIKHALRDWQTRHTVQPYAS
ncbi:DivIVA domain-containing protein [Solwaraspora sp. WMMD406]|uniref:DivIVA domain-containing protein n=1 Tax=Solwaraspora sp. WMMD406 TaxID=3016095 RepID=UPI002416BBBD|nr:DivIVA domain-containing protein [Solwaraspora sp. WMMD406]MDG4763452.1 DivIVA domain-containing protein [Solwaraspora sp. WMMD406]